MALFRIKQTIKCLDCYDWMVSFQSRIRCLCVSSLQSKLQISGCKTHGDGHNSRRQRPNCKTSWFRNSHKLMGRHDVLMTTSPFHLHSMMQITSRWDTVFLILTKISCIIIFVRHKEVIKCAKLLFHTVGCFILLDNTELIIMLIMKFHVSLKENHTVHQQETHHH